ncbi:MAG: antitoxin VbhA family protein [Endomicrobia bacterium]|nr:antitoxin VbhA family protein [Endomicrobiia bacterium]
MKSKKMSEEQVEELVSQTVADMAFEGFICTDEDKERIRRIGRGESTADEEVEKIIAAYSRVKS